MIRKTDKPKKYQHLVRKCVLAALLTGMLMPLTGSGSRQKLQAADLLDQVLVKAPDEKVSDFVISASTIDSVTLTWKKASDAGTYYISYWESGKPSTSVNREDLGDVSECKITNLKQAKYIFQIQPANKLHTGIPLKGAIASVEGAPAAAIPSEVKLNHIKPGYCSLAIKGLGDIYKTEAEIYEASGNLLESSEGDSAGIAIEDAGIKNNGFYAVRVRGYYDQAGGYRSYGDWTDYTYVSTALKSLKLSQKNGKAVVKWPAVQGADKYIVYISKNASNGFKKAAETAKTSMSVGKYGGAKLKAGKTYYIKVTAQMTRDSETYTVSSAASKIKMKSR